MVGRRTEKLTERFVGPYRIKKIVSSNAIELELPSTVKIHSVVNVSRIRRYVGQVEGQKKEQPLPVIIEGEEEWEVERILNKRRVRGKDKYLVRWKGFMAESDTWEGRENLKNAKEAIGEFEKEYWRDMEDVARQESEESCQEDSRQERYTDGQINGMTKNIGISWKGIGDNGKARDPREKEQ